MAKIDVVCPRCSETKMVIRNGHSSSGAQLYRCKHCLKTFQLSYRYNGAKPETHQTIVDMAMNGSGCRDTARVLKISLNTDDRKDSLTFGNNPESYNQLDLYNRIASSINERLMRVTASIGLHSEKCDRNTLRNASLFSKSQQPIESGGF